MYTIVWHDHIQGAEDVVVRQSYASQAELLQAIGTLLQNESTESITIFPRTIF